jgi:N6-L-threonylcarbamoyladenine synthase
VLAQKLVRAVEKTGVDSMVVAGGVACNQALRERLARAANSRGLGFFYPRPAYCTDNGAMIALTGYYRIIRGERSAPAEDVRSKYPIEEISVDEKY